MGKKIVEYINNVAQENGIQVSNDEDLFKNGVLDSIGFFVLLSFLEDTFGIEFLEEDMNPENFVSINSIIKFCKDRSNHN